MSQKFIIKPVSKRKRINLFTKTVIATTIGGTLSITSCELKDSGVVVGLPAIQSLTKDEVISIIDTRFKSELNIDMSHDIPLSLNDTLNEIIFTADGYNIDSNISYEVFDDEYSGIDSEIISNNEKVLILDHKFGDDNILIIESEGMNNYDLPYILNLFIEHYKN